MGQQHLEKGLDPMINSRGKKTKVKITMAIFIIIIVYAAELFFKAIL